jgi:hypothetical protein
MGVKLCNVMCHHMHMVRYIILNVHHGHIHTTMNPTSPHIPHYNTILTTIVCVYPQVPRGVLPAQLAPSRQLQAMRECPHVWRAQRVWSPQALRSSAVSARLMLPV